MSVKLSLLTNNDINQSLYLAKMANASPDVLPLQQPVSGPTCCKKKCPPSLTPASLCRCSAKGCKKHIHYACYEGILAKNASAKLTDAINNVEQ